MGGMKIIAKNKRASYDYFLEDKLEAGLQLMGTEVKSIRTAGCSITETHVSVDDKNEVWLHNMYIPHYQFGNIHNHEERRKRKLLLNRQEIELLRQGLSAGGRTVVATLVYFKRGRVKVEIALGKGKKLHDKRRDKAKKDVERKLRQREYD